MNQESIAPETEINLPFTADHPLAGCEAELDELCTCGRLFHRRGWSVGTSSNYSVVIQRDPLELAVTASGKDKGQLSRCNFVRLDQTGQPTTHRQPKSSAETMLHVVLAKLPGVGSILHTHSIWGTLLSDHHFERGGFEIAGYEMLKGLEGIPTHDTSVWIPIFDNTQNIPELANEVSTVLNSGSEMTHAFLIRNHGLYTWGKDVFTARRHIEVLEFLFEVIGRKTDFHG